jgi:outer membrane lipoprotein-sorting protein
MLLIMKRFFALLTALVLAGAAYAQTAEEIVAKMDAAMEQVSAENGFRMTMDIKIPILGTMSSDAWSLGDKMRLEAQMMGKKLVTWQDGQTEWTYDAGENTITIENQDKTKKSDEKENMKMFQSATEGYDVSIAKETSSAWTIKCKKNRFNTNKDDPKNMEIVIAKDTYYPMSLSAKVDLVTVTMRNLKFNVTEEEVTFNKADYPGATIIDKR